MSKKFYVVWKGRNTGVFTDWNTCKKQVDAYAGAKYKSFKTRSEADEAFNGGTSSKVKNKARSPSSASRSTIKTYSAKEIEKVQVDVKIFTDGGCEPNPGKAGSGLAVYRQNILKELWYGLYEPHGTNNTAELNALHQAMKMAQQEFAQKRSLAIFCDSKYSIQCITQWASNWQKKGWTKAGGEIKNLSLIKEMFELYQEIKSDVKILHVNGHVGVEGNEMADRMSILAIESKQGELVQYKKIIDVNAILAMRVG